MLSFQANYVRKYAETLVSSVAWICAIVVDIGNK
jgi:hypothetical protein